MEKEFLSLKIDQKKLQAGFLAAGIVLMMILGVKAYEETKFKTGYELQKNKAGEGAYEQELFAVLENEKIPLTVIVEEQKLTKKEADKILLQAKRELGHILKGENETLSGVKSDLYFIEQFPDLPVEVEWTDKAPEYFYSDGSFREDVEISESVECRVTAILSCQDFCMDYEERLTILPRSIETGQKLLEKVEQNAKDYSEDAVLKLPTEYAGKTILWKKPMDLTFLYLGMLMAAACVLLKFGGSQDQQKKVAERKASMEKDYAQIISKFTMLLSAGLNVRNAWERIDRLYIAGNKEFRPVYEEMHKAVLEMQRGIPELEVYERFGKTTGLTSYKKLMALFILEKRRGSTNLLEAMNQEMLQAWELQKRNTKQQGEKAGTKLLIPMMGMLAVVFVMILVPAFLSFRL